MNFAYLTSAKANQEPWLNRLEYFNEIGLIILVYNMVLFVPNFLQNQDLVWQSGLASLGLLAILFMANIIYLFVTTVRKIFLQTKLIKLRRKNLKEHRLKKMKNKST